MKLDIKRFRFKRKLNDRWRHFANRWTHHKFPSEAVGLLHEIGSWFKRETFLGQEFELEIIRFLCFLALNEEGLEEYPDSIKTAQRILLGKVAPQWKSFRYPGSEIAHRDILGVIAMVPRPLLSAPFHKHVASYLWGFQDLVQHDNFYAPRDERQMETCADEVQPLFETYVECMIEWELANQLISVRQPFRFYRVPEIKKILEDYYRKYQSDFAYLYARMNHSSRTYVHLENRGHRPDEHNVMAQVFIALMGIRFLVEGRGVTDPLPPPRKKFLD